VFGIDFDAVAVEVARKDGLEVHQGGLDTLRSLASRRFDHVTCSHVLEHVHEPVDWLREVWRVLKPDGTLWIQTPNACSLGHELYGVSWRGLEPPRHLTIWTESNLVKRLASSGFRQIKVLPTSIVTAMDLYASCEALRHGLDYASFIALPSAQRPRLQYLWPALKQRFTRGRSEFLTLVAIR
jgi:2-polyprenyl-3-methyl-5-hydroxy-6-metoxy-1,4-benzoquinol methylase